MKANSSAVESDTGHSALRETTTSQREWHDWLVLAELATRELGDSAKLPQLYAAQADRALRTFKRLLRYKI